LGKGKKIGIIAGVIVAVVIFGIGSTVYLLSENLVFTNRSAAMEPTIKIGDLVIADDTIPFDSLEIGEIIMFHPTSDPDRIIIMRIVAEIDDDPLTFRTKGDANPASIPGTDFPITEENYVGKVTEIIPQ